MSRPARGAPPDVTAWIDLASPSHPFFFRILAASVDGLTPRVTAREKTETVALAREVGFDPRVLGRDYDRLPLRWLGVPLRTLRLAAGAPRADVSLSFGNAMCVLASRVRGTPAIHFTDNDAAVHADSRLFALYERVGALATHTVVPAAFDTSGLRRAGVAPDRIHAFDGYAEEVSVAAFEPDPGFPDALPFDAGDYVVVRPEALDAAYVDAERTIVPELVAATTARGIDVVYLPRRPGDRGLVDPDADRVYVPDEPLHGLQLAWHARCVCTGSGTMAREAASMDKPAVSFYPSTPLSVDRALVEAGRVVHSRDPDAVAAHLASLDADDLTPDLTRARATRDEVAGLVGDLVRDCAAG